MGTLNAPYEGASIYSSEDNDPVIFQNKIDLVYKSPSPLIVTGERSRIFVDTPMNSPGERLIGGFSDGWDSNGETYYPLENITVVGVGDKTTIQATAKSTTATFGYDSNIIIGYDSFLLDEESEFIDPRNLPNTECFGLSVGPNSNIKVEPTVADSVLISHGENSSIDDEGMNNICIGTGDDADIYLSNKKSKSTVFATKGTSHINSECETILFAKTSPRDFRVGKNSVVAIAWNDGTRERISVFYEGEGDLEVDVSYRFENGSLIKL